MRLVLEGEEIMQAVVDWLAYEGRLPSGRGVSASLGFEQIGSEDGKFTLSIEVVDEPDVQAEAEAQERMPYGGFFREEGA